MRRIYERRWNTADVVYNTTQHKLCRLDEASGGDRLRDLTPARREEIADVLFNQAYSALMAVGLLSGGTHLQSVHEALQANPLSAFEVWAACGTQTGYSEALMDIYRDYFKAELSTSIARIYLTSEGPNIP